MLDKMKLKLTRLKSWLARRFEESPWESLFYIISAVSVLSKMVQSLTGYRNSKTWKREVKRRENLNKNKG